MKRIVLLALSFCLCLSFATAEVISIDSEDHIILSGHGTQILDGFSMPYSMSKFVANCEENTKITFYTKNNYETYGEYGESQKSYAGLFDRPMDFTTIMIETTGDWKFDFFALDTMNSLECNGSGSYITDRFYVTPSQIVTITFTADYEYASAYLMKIDKSGYVWQESCVEWGTWISGTESFDVIIKPDSDIVSYFWEISCSPDVSWSITAK